MYLMLRTILISIFQLIFLDVQYDIGGYDPIIHFTEKNIALMGVNDVIL